MVIDMPNASSNGYSTYTIPTVPLSLSKDYCIVFYGDNTGDRECEIECLGGKARVLENCEGCLQKPQKNLVSVETMHCCKKVQIRTVCQQR